jgi:dephospho-CoA kinase
VAFVFGLVGLPCSGKSAAAEIFSRLGAKIIDLDKIGHEVLLDPKIKKMLRESFGAGIFSAGGEIDRKSLAQVVFADKQALDQLESVVHPEIMRIATERVNRFAPGEVVVLEAAVLFAAETLADRCDSIICISAFDQVREERAAARGWSREELRARSERQLGFLNGNRKRIEAEIQNNGLIGELENRINIIWKEKQHATQEKSRLEGKKTCRG